MTLQTRIPYPPARREDILETIHGIEIADPYRWMEDAESAEVKAWLDAQQELCRPHLDALPGRERLRERYRELLEMGFISGPSFQGNSDRYFFMRRLGKEEHAKLLLHDADGTERVLLDPMAIDPTGTTTLDTWSPSWDSRLLSYQLSQGGNEESMLYVMDVDTGRIVEGPIDRCRYSSVSWLPDASGYYYVRKLHPSKAPKGEEQLHRRVYLHKLGTDPDIDDVEVFGDRPVHGSGWYFSASLHKPEGRWLTLTASMAGTNRSDLYIVDLQAGGDVTVLQEGIENKTYAFVGHDDRLYISTDVDAPNGRLLVADPAKPEKENWRELVGESDAVYESVSVLDDVLVVTTSKDALTRISIHDRETGKFIRGFPLPGAGSGGAFGRPTGGNEFWFSYTDYATPSLVHHHDLATGETKIWAQPPGWSRQEGMRSEQVFVTSKDGTKVPLFIVYREGVTKNGKRPTILTGYGGFNASYGPAYSAGYQVWTEAGGVYAIACLRGGSEYGEDWHRAGRREHKQNVFDDFEACARWLVENGWTDRDHLGISGGSNGGLLVGAAMTQHPELYRAVVCSAPLLDMVRYERFGLGSTWNDEYGSAEVPEELGWLHSYSPYHRVEEGARYPATLFTVFGSDTRVDPMHARKMCAAVQHATASDLPVLFRCETQVGHGARSLTRGLELSVDTASFLANELGLDL